MTITCGIDWAERHHDVALVDHDGVVVARQRIDTGATGFTELVGLIAEHAQDPTAVPIAIETDKGLLVAALAGAGFCVYAINPRAVARYRGALRASRREVRPRRRERVGEHLAH